jgi:hypothetical protein
MYFRRNAMNLASWLIVVCLSAIAFVLLLKESRQNPNVHIYVNSPSTEAVPLIRLSRTPRIIDMSELHRQQCLLVNLTRYIIKLPPLRTMLADCVVCLGMTNTSLSLNLQEAIFQTWQGGMVTVVISYPYGWPLLCDVVISMDDQWMTNHFPRIASAHMRHPVNRFFILQTVRREYSERAEMMEDKWVIPFLIETVRGDDCTDTPMHWLSGDIPVIRTIE